MSENFFHEVFAPIGFVIKESGVLIGSIGKEIMPSLTIGLLEIFKGFYPIILIGGGILLIIILIK